MKYLHFGPKNKPDLRLVFFHGYGASAQDLSDFRHLKLPVQSQWIFPEGPLESDLAPGGQAWFPLKWHLSPAGPDRPDQGPPSQIHENPEGLFYLDKHIKEIQSFLSSFPSENLILGGFSQGAVMALNVALRMKKAPLALAFLSGALFPARLLEEKKQSFSQGGRFFQSHGQKDPLLDFESAKKVSVFLESLNWQGPFVGFEGGHEIPSTILSQMQNFLANLDKPFDPDV